MPALSPRNGSILTNETAKALPYSPDGTTLIGESKPVRRKLRVVRWLTKRVGEYDIDNDLWNSVEAQVPRAFLPFSRSVYLPDGGIIVMGGLSEEVPTKPSFSS